MIVLGSLIIRILSPRKSLRSTTGRALISRSHFTELLDGLKQLLAVTVPFKFNLSALLDPPLCGPYKLGRLRNDVTESRSRFACVQAGALENADRDRAT